MKSNKIGNKIPKQDGWHERPPEFRATADSLQRMSAAPSSPALTTEQSRNYPACSSSSLAPEQPLCQPCWPVPAEAPRGSDWQEIKLRAKAEGVLESAMHPDGNWYVEIAPGRLKKVRYDFWCPHCDSQLTEHSLVSHLEGKEHRKRVHPPEPWTPQASRLDVAAQRVLEPWQELAEDGQIKCRLCNKFCDGYHENSGEHARKLAWFKNDPSMRLPSSSSSSRAVAKPLEDWQELDQEGSIKCLACNKFCDGCHEFSDDHRKRLERWLAERRENFYRAPSQVWLAWMPCQGWGDKTRHVKCLLCNKWVMDMYHPNEVDPSYDGQHGNLNSSRNQKDHFRKLENIGEYMKDGTWWRSIMEERNRWHPDAAPVSAIENGTGQSTVDRGTASQLTQAAVESTVPMTQSTSHVMQPTYPDPQSIRPQIPDLPDGWEALWSEVYETWYFSNGLDPAQWELPTAPAVNRLQESSRPLPPSVSHGWDAVWSSEFEEYYFVNRVTNKSQWEVPTRPAIAEQAKVVASRAADPWLSCNGDRWSNAPQAQREITC